MENFEAKNQKSLITDSCEKLRLGKYISLVYKMRNFKVEKEATCSSFVITTFVLVRIPSIKEFYKQNISYGRPGGEL